MEALAKSELHYDHVLAKLFKELDNDALRLILKIGEKLQMEFGAYLFRQGDTENSLYIVLSGRLRAIRENELGSHILGDIGEGEPVGEFALFTNEPRMASVLVLRKSTILKINKVEYLNLVSKIPAFAGVLTNFIIKRMQRNVLQQKTESAPKNIAIINLQPEKDISPWTDDIQKCLEKNAVPIQIYDHASQPEGSYQSIFNSLEQHEGLNILVCSETYPDWTRQSLVYADLVIVATDFYADKQLYQIEKEFDLYAQTILNKKIYIAFLHPEEAGLPENTSHWLKERNVNLHIHIRQNHLMDINRFCRIITNKAVGLVLGGGGAKGFAHVGVVKALLKVGIEIDFVGGTSAGALFGIIISHSDFDKKKIEFNAKIFAESKATSNDYSFPFLSLMSGKKLTNFIKKMLGHSCLEDIWVNSYCVSTNFSNATAAVHDKGLAWKMIQASIAIPGVYPPVVIEKQLHVDGGVVDNLPIEPMYRYPVRHIIAISLSGQNNKLVSFEDTPSVGRLFWDKITKKKQYKIPGITSLLINSLTLNSRQKQEIAKSKVSVYFEINLKGIGFLDGKKWKETIQNGYDQTTDFLENLPDEEKFWQ